MPKGILEGFSTGHPGLQGQAGKGYEQMGKNGNLGQSAHRGILHIRPQSGEDKEATERSQRKDTAPKRTFQPRQWGGGECTKMDLEFIKSSL